MCFFTVSQHKHLYDRAAWKRLRAHQLRSHPLCRMHLELGQPVAAAVVDHINAHRGDEALFFDPTNLQSLCKHCHDAHKQAQEHSAGGILRGAGLDGRPLDLAHPWHRAAPADGVGGANLHESAIADRQVPSICMPAKSEGGA